MAPKPRIVKFPAVIAKTSIENRRDEELVMVIELRPSGTAGTDAQIGILQNFANDEELMVTLEPRQLTMGKDTPED